MGSSGAQPEKQGSPELLAGKGAGSNPVLLLQNIHFALVFLIFFLFPPQTIPTALSVFLWSWGLGYPADSCSFKPTQTGLQPPQEREAGAIATAWIFFFLLFFKFLFFLSLRPEQIMQ